MGKKQTTITEQVIAAIESAEISRYEIAKQTGVSQAALSRFVNGTRSLTIESLDKLAECLGIRLVVEKKPKRKTKGK